MTGDLSALVQEALTTAVREAGGDQQAVVDARDAILAMVAPRLDEAREQVRRAGEALQSLREDLAAILGFTLKEDTDVADHVRATAAALEALRCDRPADRLFAEVVVADIINTAFVTGEINGVAVVRSRETAREIASVVVSVLWQAAHPDVTDDSGWRPMFYAPRTGEPIEVSWRRGAPLLCAWVDGCWRTVEEGVAVLPDVWRPVPPDGEA